MTALGQIRNGGAQAPSRCHIQARGGFVLLAPDGLEVRVKSRKAIAIIAYLALGPTRTASREKLCGLLWSEQPETMARAALRQCLRRLSADLSAYCPDLVRIEREAITLVPENVAVDLQVMLDCIEAGGRITGRSDEADPEQILYGFDTLDPSFTAWLRILRETWHERFAAALGRGMVRPDLPEEVRTAMARALFGLDATHEPAARVLITSQLRTGNLPSALKIYRRLWDALGEEWGEEPSAELQSLIVQAKTPATEMSLAAIAEPAPEAAPPPPAPPAIGRLPVLLIEGFEQSGPWNLPGYFIDGFRRELIAALVRFREWVVADALSVGDHSAADYAIGCGFRQMRDDALLTITMLDRRSGDYVMSDRVRLSVESWGESLERIIRKTSVSLNIHVSKRRTQAAAARDLPELAAFDLWLRANELRKSWRPDSYEEAERLYREVIARAPDYAPAYSSLAGLFSTRHLSAPGIERRTEWEAAAREYALKAVSLDPLNAHNQLALAWANAMQGSYAQAEFHFDLSLELNPCSPRLMMPCAHGYSFMGLHERATRLADQALEIHPSMLAVHWGYLMCIRYFVQEFAAAIEAGEQAGDSIFDLKAWLAATCAMAGEGRRARKLMEEFVEQARAGWMGAGKPAPEAIARWFLHAFPIRRREDFNLLREGLALSGLPMPGPKVPEPASGTS